MNTSGTHNESRFFHLTISTKMCVSLELIGLVQQIDDSPRCIRSIRLKATQTRAKRNQDLNNGYENIDRNIFFTVKEERRTRGHGVALAKKQCRLDIRKFSFSQRIVNEWNKLSADCVGARSVNMFKNKIDIYLRRAGYT